MAARTEETLFTLTELLMGLLLSWLLGPLTFPVRTSYGRRVVSTAPGSAERNFLARSPRRIIRGLVVSLHRGKTVENGRDVAFLGRINEILSTGSKSATVDSYGDHVPFTSHVTGRRLCLERRINSENASLRGKIPEE